TAEERGLMLRETRKITMQLDRRFLISLRGFLPRFVKSEMSFFEIALNHGTPTVAVVVLVNTFISACVVFVYGLVLFVLPVTGFSQIFPAIVAVICGFMVDLFFWPSSGFYHPRQNVGVVRPLIDSNEAI